MYAIIAGAAAAAAGTQWSRKGPVTAVGAGGVIIEHHRHKSSMGICSPVLLVELAITSLFVGVSGQKWRRDQFDQSSTHQEMHMLAPGQHPESGRQD